MNPFPTLFFVALFVIAFILISANHLAEVERLNARGCAWTGGLYMEGRWGRVRARFEYDCGGTLEWSSVKHDDVKARKR